MYRFIILIFVLSASAYVAAAPNVTWRQLLQTNTTNNYGLLGDAEKFARVVPPRAYPAKGLPFFTDKLKAVYESFDNPPTAHYFCTTVYYTPQQNGFREERGFDVSRKWLGGKPYGHDFYIATRMEGFSRLKYSTNGLPYLNYQGKRYSKILGDHGNELKDRESIAINRSNSLFGYSSRVWILDPQIYNQFGAIRFQVADTGFGLAKSQIDIYWGEDDPSGPGGGVWRPASCDTSSRWTVPCLIFK